MSVDLEVIEQHRRFEDPVAGFSEEFIQPRLGMGKTVGVLTRPMGSSGSIGWVVCHAFGMEQIHLGRLDVIVARTLASAGFTVLRFAGQGYGDSELGMDVVGLSSHLAEAEDAVELMRRQHGVEQVGLMGARLGGTVAALAAARLNLPYLAMWDPVVRGKQYVRELLRSQMLSEIVESGDGGGQVHLSKIQEELDEQGWTDLRGWRLSKSACDEISRVDLGGSLAEYGGSALVVALSRTPKVPKSLGDVAEAMSNRGVDCTLALVQDPFATQFGQFRWRAVEGGRSKRDTQLELNEKIADVTTAWATELPAKRRAGAEARP
jgi:hypothetical protein